MDNIIRVFPRRTSYTPTDDMVFVGEPGLFLPDADAVHVSVTFTWDIAQARHLRSAWAQHYPVVKIGGPALGGCDGFEPGLYVKQGVTFTSRGCNNNCPWCLVPAREGRIRVLPIRDGWIVQDNNLLQCPHWHISQVLEMLKRQPKAAVFAGGIDARLVDGWFAEQLSGIRVKALFLAADTDAAIEPLREAMVHLGWLGREKLRCYVLIGRESMDRAERRLRKVWDIGCMPFAQLYQPADGLIDYSREWKVLARAWSRPAIIRRLLWTSSSTAKSSPTSE